MYLCKQVVYHNFNSTVNIDNVLDGVSLIEISSETYPSLHSIIGGNFAYIITLFYSTPSITSRRMQIAISYNSNKTNMAIRSYGVNGWNDWNIPGYKAINNTDYTIQRLRNIAAGTSIPTTLTNGDIYFVYTA